MYFLEKTMNNSHPCVFIALNALTHGYKMINGIHYTPNNEKELHECVQHIKIIKEQHIKAESDHR